MYQNIIIRTKEQLDKMGELGDAIVDMWDDGAFEYKNFPIVYQYMKGKDGESVDTDKINHIGKAYDVRIDSYGNLICDVDINPVMRKSIHFQNTIDNLVVAKHTITDRKGNVRTGCSDSQTTFYELVQFVIYDKEVKREETRISKGEELVKKNYAAPKEAYTGNPNSGGHVKNMLKEWENALKEADQNCNHDIGYISAVNMDDVKFNN